MSRLSETRTVPESNPATYERLERATSELDPPFALVDLEAFRSNEKDLVRRAAGKPIRIASKSVRCRTLQQRVLGSDGWSGTLAFTLPEALWLATNGFEDLVVAYPTADRAALRACKAGDRCDHHHGRQRRATRLHRRGGDTPHISHQGVH